MRRGRGRGSRLERYILRYDRRAQEESIGIVTDERETRAFQRTGGRGCGRGECERQSEMGWKRLQAVIEEFSGSRSAPGGVERGEGETDESAQALLDQHPRPQILPLIPDGSPHSRLVLLPDPQRSAILPCCFTVEVEHERLRLLETLLQCCQLKFERLDLLLSREGRSRHVCMVEEMSSVYREGGSEGGGRRRGPSSQQVEI